MLDIVKKSYSRSDCQKLADELLKKDQNFRYSASNMI